MPAVATKTFGLVLSGGGTRGAAHIGVIRALIEHRLEPGVVAGASAGAVVGALYAAGHSPAEMLEFFRELNPVSPRRVALRKPGLLDSMKFAPLFRRYLPEDRFEALKRKLYVVATDLLSGHAAVFDSGQLILPLLASSSLPAVYSPTVIDGRWYADGGIVDNFPVRVLKDRCDTIVGSHVHPLREATPRDLRSTVDVVARALDIGVFARARDCFADCAVVIVPRTEPFGLFESRRLAAIEAAGYEAALERIGSIRKAVG